MNTDLKEFFMNLSIDGFFNNKLNLGTDAMLSNNDISIYQLPEIDRSKYVYIKNIGRDNDIILGEKYDILYSRKDPKNYQKIDCEIDYVSLKKGDNIGIIPKGYGGIVRLKFKDEVPEIMNNLLMQDKDEVFNKEKHQYLYFTTQEVMNEILEELEKA